MEHETNATYSVQQKSRVRSEINAQIDQFLRAGGKIIKVGNRKEAIRPGSVGNSIGRESQHLMDFLD